MFWMVGFVLTLWSSNFLAKYFFSCVLGRANVEYDSVAEVQYDIELTEVKTKARKLYSS